MTVDIAFDGIPDLPDECCRVLHAIDGAGAVDGLSPRPRIGLFCPHKELIVGFIDPNLILAVFERETVDDDNCGGSPFVKVLMSDSSGFVVLKFEGKVGSPGRPEEG